MNYLYIFWSHLNEFWWIFWGGIRNDFFWQSTPRSQKIPPPDQKIPPPNKDFSLVVPITAQFSPAELLNALLYWFYRRHMQKFGNKRRRRRKFDISENPPPKWGGSEMIIFWESTPRSGGGFSENPPPIGGWMLPLLMVSTNGKKHVFSYLMGLK